MILSYRKFSLNHWHLLSNRCCLENHPQNIMTPSRIQ